MLISDWSSDVCSSDLLSGVLARARAPVDQLRHARAQFDQAHQCRFGHAQHLVVPAAHRRHEIEHVGEPCLGVAAEMRVVRGARDAGFKRGFGGVDLEIGRASCRERVGQYGEISVVAVTLKKKKKTTDTKTPK